MLCLCCVFVESTVGCGRFVGCLKADLRHQIFNEPNKNCWIDSFGIRMLSDSTDNHETFLVAKILTTRKLETNVWRVKHTEYVTQKGRMVSVKSLFCCFLYYFSSASYYIEHDVCVFSSICLSLSYCVDCFLVVHICFLIPGHPNSYLPCNR